MKFTPLAFLATEKTYFPFVGNLLGSRQKRLKRLIKHYSREKATSRRSRIAILEQAIKDLADQEKKVKMLLLYFGTPVIS